MKDKTPISIQPREQRLQEWETFIGQELQMLVQRAASIRQNITSAKTAAKRQYFEKKFKKTQQEVMSMVATMERVKQMSAQSRENHESDAPTTES